MNLVFTRWLYPLRNPIVLCDNPRFILDNPRSAKEVKEVAALLKDNYIQQLRGFFPPTAEKKYISLDWMISKFRARFGRSDEYVREVLGGHRPKLVFHSLARIWIVARYDDEGAEKQIEESREQLRSDGKIGLILLEEDNPIVRNSTKLQNYLSLFSLLIHTEEDEFFGNPILLGSEEYPTQGSPFDEHLWRNALIMFMVHSTSRHEKTKSDKLAWTCFPYARERLLHVRDSLNNAFACGDGEFLMYIGNILRVVEHDARDIRVRFILLVSLIELLLTHNPDTTRYNVEDSISRQFRLKTAIMVHLQNPKIDLGALDTRLKELYTIIENSMNHQTFTDRFKNRHSTRKIPPFFLTPPPKHGNVIQGNTVLKEAHHAVTTARNHDHIPSSPYGAGVPAARQG